MKKKNVTLYNLIFPIWMLWLIPVTWLVVLPANFVIDLLVTLAAMKCLKVEQPWQKTKSVVVKVWLFGFASDFIGTALMFLSNLIDFGYETALGKWWYQNITNAVAYDPFESVYAFLWVAVSVLLAGVCIYFFNQKFSFRNIELLPEQKRKIALVLAVVTAPYLFFLPTAWFF